MLSRLVRYGLFLAAGVFLASCGGDDQLSFGDRTPAEVAIELIESEAMGQRLGLDQLADATCVDPAEALVGTTFPCSADSDGKQVDFVVTLDGDNELFAGPTNVVAALDVASLEGDAVRSLNASNGFDFPEDAIECGNRSVVLDESQVMPCVLTDPATGATFDVPITITNMDVLAFTVEVTGEVAS